MSLGFILGEMFPTTKTNCLFLDLKPIGLCFNVLKISLSYLWHINTSYRGVANGTMFP